MLASSAQGQALVGLEIEPDSITIGEERKREIVSYPAFIPDTLRTIPITEETYITFSAEVSYFCLAYYISYEMHSLIIVNNSFCNSLC